jgi:hypothetical protein
VRQGEFEDGPTKRAWTDVEPVPRQTFHLMAGLTSQEMKPSLRRERCVDWREIKGPFALRELDFMPPSNRYDDM